MNISYWGGLMMTSNREDEKTILNDEFNLKEKILKNMKNSDEVFDETKIRTKEMEESSNSNQREIDERRKKFFGDNF